MKDNKELLQFLETFAVMIAGVKRRLALKWFALDKDEIDSLVNMSIFKLWRKNKHETFVLTKKTLSCIAERAIIKQICKEPNVEVHITKENGKREKKVTVHPLSSLDAEIEDGISLLDILPDVDFSIDEAIIQDETVKEQKSLVLAVISERTYKQLCFEYENKCVSQENLNLIQKIKKELAKL